MRKHISSLDTRRLEWSPAGAPGIFQKLLNSDPVSGARTLLLKSDPRPKDRLTDRRPQYHPVDEEFFCLSGRFTLEGEPWLKPHCYVYYPPMIVHGFAVDVPGGYEIYLRNSGSIATTRVDSPSKDSLYVLDRPDERCSEVAIKDCETIFAAAKLGKAFAAIITRESDDSSEGAMFAALPRGCVIKSGSAGFGGSLEIFVVSGGVEGANREKLMAGNYAFLSPGTQILIKGSEDVSLLAINHVGKDIVEAMTNAGCAFL